MPRPKKPFGTAADPRNGQQVRTSLPQEPAVERLPAPEGLHPRIAEAWEAYWDDRPALLLTPASVVVLRRWAHAMHRYVTMLAEADEEPLVHNSQGQTPNPLYKIAADAKATAESCERQLGIGVLNAANLGIAAATERRSLADLNARYSGETPADDDTPAGGESSDDGDDDPRLRLVV